MQAAARSPTPFRWDHLDLLDVGGSHFATHNTYTNARTQDIQTTYNIHYVVGESPTSIGYSLP